MRSGAAIKNPNNGSDNLEPDRVVFYGRTLFKYLKFFDLDLSLWKECTILDCPQGASSFVAEASRGFTQLDATLYLAMIYNS